MKSKASISKNIPIWIFLFLIHCTVQLSAQDSFDNALGLLRFQETKDAQRKNNSYVFQKEPPHLTDRQIGQENLLDFGFYVEGISAAWFLQYEIESSVKVGGSFGIGYNMGNIVLFAEERFGNGKNLRGEPIRLRELVNASFFLEYETKAFDLQSGIRFFSFSYDGISFRSEREEGTFVGLYVQPLFGRGSLQYAFRVMYGRLLTTPGASNRTKEVGVLLSPVIFSWTF